MQTLRTKEWITDYKTVIASTQNKKKQYNDSGSHYTNEKIQGLGHWHDKAKNIQQCRKQSATQQSKWRHNSRYVAKATKKWA